LRSRLSHAKPDTRPHNFERLPMSDAWKVAVVTGASQGVGEGIVKAFLERGYRVVATSRSIRPSSDPNLLTVAGDIGDPATGKRVIEEAVAKFGRVDTLVNNAGIFIASAFTDYTEEQYRQKLRTNLDGFFFITPARDPGDVEAGRRPYRADHNHARGLCELQGPLRARVHDQGRS
jgi:NAD(P)-dependent dehydrogenase (short-subunit alcohol dehydrogenase family)